MNSMISLLKTVKPEEANDLVKDVYKGFSEKMGKVPNVIQFHTASQKVYGYLMGMFNDFSMHPTIDPVLQAYLRVIISHREGGEYCVEFQSFLLQAYGVSNEEIKLVLEDPENVRIDEKQKQLLLFALRLIEGSPGNTSEDLHKLHNLGWSDREIYEMCFLGGVQKGMIPLVKGFEVEHDF